MRFEKKECNDLCREDVKQLGKKVNTLKKKVAVARHHEGEVRHSTKRTGRVRAAQERTRNVRRIFPLVCDKSVCQQSHSGNETKKAAPCPEQDVVLPRIIFAVKLANTILCNAMPSTRHRT